MDVELILLDAEERMDKALQSLSAELGTLRTGRANPQILDRINVEYYGAVTPLRQMANISVQEGTTLVIQPYDKSCIGDIEKVISKSDLGLNPNNDGTVIRIVIPPLSQDRRKELAKVASKMGEEAKVAVRNVRRDAMDELKKLEKQGMSEDEVRGHQDDIQKKTDAHVKKIDTMVSEKEAEILTV